MKNLKEFKPLWKMIKEEKGKIILAVILMLMGGLSGILTAHFNGLSIEAITKLDIKSSITYLIIYLLLVLIFYTYFINIANSILQKIENKLTRKLGYYTYKKALNMPAYAYENKTSGEIINRITNDADSLSFSFGQLINVIASLLGTFIIAIYIFANSWIVGVEIIAFLFMLFITLKIYNPKLKQTHEDRKKGQDQYTSLVTESIRGIREIKTLGIKDNLLKNMHDIIVEIFKRSDKEIDIRRRFNLITQTLKILLEVGIYITCVILLYYRKISLTFFIEMTYHVNRYAWLIENINNLSQTYQRLIVSLGRVNEILENREYKDEKYGNVDKEVKNGVIEFRDVKFGYPNEAITLNNFNMKIEPNKKIAIVGKSGQGKSTLFNLLTRIFDPIEGKILIDGIDLKDYSEESLRKSISIIRQEPFIFNRTIKENFQLVDNNIKLKTIRKYTKLAYLDDYIMSLPKQYDTILGEGGVNLSGGQKQRLSIARTLAKESKIILFDEATSSLDNQSQEYIKGTIDELVKDHTILIVAHRLSTIIDADIIYVVDKGQIVAVGTHKELLEKNDIYKNLYTKEGLNKN